MERKRVALEFRAERDEALDKLAAAAPSVSGVTVMRNRLMSHWKLTSERAQQVAMDLASLASEASPVAGEAKGEPAAWQGRSEDGHPWEPVNDPVFFRERGWQVRALYTTPPAPTDALKVAVDALETAKRRCKEIACGSAFQPAIHAGAAVREMDTALAAIRAKETT